MGAAEDDNYYQCRPKTTGPESDDAMDDAADVCLSYHVVPQRFGPLLGHFQYYSDSNAVFRYRVGRFEAISRR